MAAATEVRNNEFSRKKNGLQWEQVATQLTPLRNSIAQNETHRNGGNRVFNFILMKLHFIIRLTTEPVRSSFQEHQLWENNECSWRFKKKIWKELRSFLFGDSQTLAWIFFHLFFFLRYENYIELDRNNSPLKNARFQSNHNTFVSAQWKFSFSRWLESIRI